MFGPNPSSRSGISDIIPRNRTPSFMAWPCEPGNVPCLVLVSGSEVISPFSVVSYFRVAYLNVFYPIAWKAGHGQQDRRVNRIPGQNME